MKSTREQVLEFHQIFNHPVRIIPNYNVPEAGLRYELVREELEELETALKEEDRVETADALGDLEYVIEGAGLVFGLPEIPYTVWDEDITDLLAELKDQCNVLRRVVVTGDIVEISSVLSNLKSALRGVAKQLDIPLDEIIEAIHDSNMSKLGEDGVPIYREADNKVMKGPNFYTPTSRIKTLLGLDEKPVEEEKPVEKKTIPKKTTTKSAKSAKTEEEDGNAES